MKIGCPLGIIALSILFAALFVDNYDTKAALAFGAGLLAMFAGDFFDDRA